MLNVTEANVCTKIEIWVLFPRKLSAQLHFLKFGERPSKSKSKLAYDQLDEFPGINKNEILRWSAITEEVKLLHYCCPFNVWISLMTVFLENLEYRKWWKSCKCVVISKFWYGRPLIFKFWVLYRNSEGKKSHKTGSTNVSFQRYILEKFSKTPVKHASHAL